MAEGSANVQRGFGAWLRRAYSSLAFRVVATSTLLAIVAFLAIATVLSSLFRQASENGFENVLSAHLFNLIGSIAPDGDGELRGNPNLGDVRFTIPDSGWYWSVTPVSEVEGRALRSPSMTRDIAHPPITEVPFSADFQRLYDAEGLAGERVLVLETEFVMGEADEVASFRVMGNLTELDEEIVAFERQINVYLLIFGAGMIAINAIAVLMGLRPLGRVRKALAEIRAGTATRLTGNFPNEIRPLAEETNALIESNRRIVERARTQVGNLAHSLKTPLAVVTNEAREMGGKRGVLIADQADSMRQQVEHYLQRARIAAQRDTVAFRAPVLATLERMVRVMSRLNPEKAIEFTRPGSEIVFAGEKEDLEEIAGNLMENAMKWSRARVVVSVSRGSAEDGERFELRVADDGPGIAEEDAREALKRGTRLDESVPGTGLGLAIVADLVREYGGTLKLERAEEGGLAVRVALKRAQG